MCYHMTQQFDSLRYVPRRTENMFTHTKTHTVLLMTSKRNKPLKMPISCGMGKQNALYPHNGMLLDKKKVLIQATTKMNLENIVLSKTSQSYILYDFIHMQVKNRQIHRNREERLVISKAWEQGGMGNCNRYGISLGAMKVFLN